MTANQPERVDTEERRLCSDCVGEAFLRAEIEKHGRDGVCFYCSSEGKTFSIGEMADHIEIAFKEHFYLTPNEPSSVEYAMSKEGDHDWERKGDAVAEVIGEQAEIETAPAEDIRGVLEERHFDREPVEMGEEGPFDEDARYAETDVDDAESQAGWLHFEQSLKTQAR